jgi:N-methylhydantoinase A/oxoprolinase/acetone carboxylase beta subunit
MAAEVALECPVETILSGPAASVVGAAFLTALSDFVVSDMGGTTTDIAIVRGGRPVLKAEGARVGGWSTMVEAVDVRTYGLGGDSEIGFDNRGHMTLGTRRVVPLSLLAATAPEILETLRRQAQMEHLPLRPGRFALRQVAAPEGTPFSAAERLIWEALAPGPRPLSDIVRGASGTTALRSLTARGLIAQAGMTPSDAMHVLGRQSQWNAEAARLGARIWVQHGKSLRQDPSDPDIEQFCAAIRESVVRATGRVLYETLLAQDPGIEPRDGSWGALGDAVVGSLVKGEKPARLLRVTMDLDLPLVAIGGPVDGYYPEVAKRLAAALVIPEHAAVSNAIGAVSGVVSRTVEIVVTQPKIGLFRVHASDGNKDFRDAEAALAHASERSRMLAEAAAVRAGAARPVLETVLHKKTARQPGGGELLVEAVLRSTAIGRPEMAGYIEA